MTAKEMTAEQLEDWLQKHPQDDVKTRPDVLAILSSPHYADRGMWGPLGGKNGTPSAVWENPEVPSSSVSEFSLMTFVKGGKAMTLDEVKQQANAEEDEYQISAQHQRDAHAEHAESSYSTRLKRAPMSSEKPHKRCN